MTNEPRSRGHLQTRAVHAGRDHSLPAGFRGSAPAIHASSSYLADSSEQLYGVFRGEPGVVYSRIGNPTVQVLEAAMRELEDGEGAVAFGSGMAALHAAWLACNLQQGDTVVASRDCYGSTLTLLREFFGRMGVDLCEVDLSDTCQAAECIRRCRPRIVHGEIISNPLLKVMDLPEIASAASEAGSKMVVDATFATPVLLRALNHGADVVVHSVTKYLSGHGDCTGGVCVARDPELLGRLRQVAVNAGAALSPFEAWLTLRGLRTLPLRMDAHCANAQIVAEWLSRHPRVARVHYPGLRDHPQHEVAARMLEGNRFGGMIAFEIRNGGRKSAMAFMDALKLIAPATTLGDVFSLVLYPSESSHRDRSGEELKAMGISPGLIRLSVGIEQAEDIMADLNQALPSS